ncbi:MAG: DUF3592 domain-containing protein [Myxococcaceae bacterium]
MQLAIPNAPRKVRLSQVPGAFARLSVAGLLGLGVAAGLWLVAMNAGKWLSSERDFLDNAVEVEGQLQSAQLPPFNQREGGVALLTVIYLFDGRDLSASRVKTNAEYAEGLGMGAKLKLLVDPRKPEQPREAGYERDQAGLRRFAPFGLGLGLLLAALLLAFEARRALRSELNPLRHGMLVWLTPEGELPDTKKETVFKAHYYRQDVKHDVQARARPGRAPVRNGEKVLAAVVPTRPTWVRVIDEDLAKTLGWYA